jgi:hypothetical protein
LETVIKKLTMEGPKNEKTAKGPERELAWKARQLGDQEFFRPEPGMGAHVRNPSYSGGRDQEDRSSKPAWANSS